MDQMNQDTNMAVTKQEGGMGAWVGITIIVLVLAAGALYLWYTKSKPAPQVPTQTTAQANDTNIYGGGASDSASVIEADLQAADTGNAASQVEVQ